MTNKELVEKENFFHIFVENHLKIYPEERINTFGLCEEIDPLKAMKLFAISNEIKNAVLEENIQSWMNPVLTDLHKTAEELKI